MNGSLFVFAARNLARQKSRMILALLILSASVFCIIFIGGLYENMFREVEESQIYENGHFWVNVKANSEDYSFISSNVIREIEATNTIKDYRFSGSFSGIVGSEDKSSIFSGELFDKSLDEQFYEGKLKKVKIGKILSDNLGVKAGSEVSGFGADYSFGVVIDEVVETGNDESDSFYLSVPFDSLTDSEDEIYGLVSSIYFHLSDISDRTISKIKGLFNPNNVEFHFYNDNSSYYSQVKTIYESNLRFIIIALIITSFFTVSTSYTMVVSERLWEFGTQKALGFNCGQIMRTMFSEAFVLSISGFVVGLLISLSVGLIVNIVGGLVLPPPPTVNNSIILHFTVPAKYVIVALIEVVAVCIISAFVVSREVIKKSVIELLV